MTFFQTCEKNFNLVFDCMHLCQKAVFCRVQKGDHRYIFLFL